MSAVIKIGPLPRSRFPASIRMSPCRNSPAMPTTGRAPSLATQVSPGIVPPAPPACREGGEVAPFAGRGELARADRWKGDAEPPFELAGEDLPAAVGPIPFRREGAPASAHDTSCLPARG